MHLVPELPPQLLSSQETKTLMSQKKLPFLPHDTLTLPCLEAVQMAWYPKLQ